MVLIADMMLVAVMTFDLPRLADFDARRIFPDVFGSDHPPRTRDAVVTLPVTLPVMPR